jgi:hypothetical protein
MHYWLRSYCGELPARVSPEGPNTPAPSLNSQTEASPRPERSEVEGPAVHHPQERISMKAPPSPLSSRAKPRDLQCAPPPTRILRYQPSTPKTDRSGGTCCSSSAGTNFNESATLPFVIPSEAEGSAVRPSAQPNTPVPTLNPQTRLKWRDLLFIIRRNEFQ